LTDSEYAGLAAETGAFGEVDVAANGKVKHRFIPDLQRQLRLIEVAENWTDAQLIGWLDRNLQYDDITPADKAVFLTALVADVIDVRGMPLAQLLRRKVELRKIAERKIRDFRRQARAQAHQALLFGDDSVAVVVTPERCFSYHPDHYPMRTACSESDTFNKHYYPKVGEIDNPEELACAQFLDHLPEVQYWVRNLERQENFSFWLQTATDKFYPDFVCRLTDGRILLVEYKGADRWSNDDSREKRRLGELWMDRSNGTCLFIMPKGKDFDAIRALMAQGRGGST
ncbi:MAG: hypothetical protein JW955_22035, partial [Sedimentisphaerales bacterium]|nr:hypothetical protein [Sedimentisphaerales bacterium]